MADPDRQDVVQLLERRRAIQGWLDRLDTQEGTANERVLAKVRADYEGRLASVLQELSHHQEAVRKELAEAEVRLHTAATDQAEAGENLEEGHLRHRIGELTDSTWDSLRKELEDVAQRAHQAELQASGEVMRLREILEQLAGNGSPEVEEEAIEESDATLESGPVSVPFLADIDRALEGAGEGDEEEEGATAPKPGLKCPDCGYTNDISAWFCGVCGADIG